MHVHCRILVVSPIVNDIVECGREIERSDATLGFGVSRIPWRCPWHIPFNVTIELWRCIKGHIVRLLPFANDNDVLHARLHLLPVHEIDELHLVERYIVFVGDLDHPKAVAAKVLHERFGNELSLSSSNNVCCGICHVVPHLGHVVTHLGRQEGLTSGVSKRVIKVLIMSAESLIHQ